MADKLLENGRRTHFRVHPHTANGALTAWEAATLTDGQLCRPRRRPALAAAAPAPATHHLSLLYRAVARWAMSPCSQTCLSFVDYCARQKIICFRNSLSSILMLAMQYEMNVPIRGRISSPNISDFPTSVTLRAHVRPVSCVSHMIKHVYRFV